MSQLLKILIIEEIPTDVEFIIRELKKADFNFEYKNVVSKADFIAALDNYKPDVILSDHNLQEFNSIEALEILKQKQLKVPFILVTGSVNEEFVAQIIKLGADDYVLKKNLIRLPLSIDAAIEQKAHELELFNTYLKLVKSEEKYRLLLSQASDAIFYLDGKGYFLQVNESAIKMFGYTEGDFMKLKISDLIAEDDKLLPLIEIVKHKGSIIRERKYRHKNGSTILVEINAKRLPGNRFLTVVRDIHDRIESQKQIKQSDIKYKELIERVSDAFVSLDKEWCYSYVNKKAGEIFQRDPSTLIGKHIWTEFPEGIGQPFYQAYHRAMETQKYEYFVEYYPPYDLWFENHIYPSLDGLTIYFRDITVIKKAELEKQKLISIIETSNDFIGLATLEGNPIFLNENGRKLVGLKTDEDISGLKITDFFAEDYLDTVLNEQLPAIMQDGVWKGEVLMRHFKTGKQTSVQMSGFLIKDKQTNEPIAIGNIASDITIRKRIELILEKENEVLSMIARKLPLKEILTKIALNYEMVFEGAKCSILTLNDDGKTLQFQAGPSLPEAYNNATDGLPIGPTNGSCGTAAYRKETVLVSDIATDPLWKKYREVTENFDLKSCWSTPILTNDNKVLGTFAIYYSFAKSQDPNEFEIIKRASDLVKIVLEQDFNRRKLEENEERLRLSTELANVAVWEYDYISNKMERSTNHDQLFGLEQQETRELAVFINATHPDDSDYSNAIIQESIAKGGPNKYDFDFRVVYPDKSIHWLVVKGDCIKRNAEGVGVLYRGCLIDITKRKVAQLKLAESETMFSNAFRTNVMGLAIINSERKFTEVNDALLEITEGKRDNFIGKTTIETGVFDFTVPGMLDTREKLWARVQKEGSIKNVEVEVLLESGKKKTVHLSFEPLELLGESSLLITVNDITDTKIAEEKLTNHKLHLEELVLARTSELEKEKVKAESADRLKSAFLATMSHELRTPLNSIIGFTGILLKEFAGPINEEQAKQINMVKNSGQHLLGLINDILDISKIEAGELSLYYTKFDYLDSVKKIIDTLTPLATKKGIPIILKNTENSIQITSDKLRVEQIVINLLSNAIKFTHEGKITVEILLQKNEISTSIKDTGIGISEDGIKKLFIPFTQLDTGLARNHEGSGLGLSISEKLLEKLEGSIYVDSKIGIGSTFTYILPHQNINLDL